LKFINNYFTIEKNNSEEVGENISEDFTIEKNNSEEVNEEVNEK